MRSDEASAPVAALMAQARETPNRVALIEGDAEWTCAELIERSGVLAAGLVARGVVPGDRIALHLHSTVDAVLSYLACLRIGATAVPLNTRLTTPELADLVLGTRPVLYLGQRELYPQFAPVPEELVPVDARFVARPEPGCLATDLRQLFGHSGELVDVSPDLDAMAMLLPTSGTTGQSKIVIWSHRTLASLYRSAAGRGIEPGVVMPILTPLMHGAAVYHLFNAFSQRATAVLIPQFDADVVLDAMARHKVTSVFGLPFMCAELVRAQRTRPRDVGALHTATVAGDVCPPQVEGDFQAVFGVPLRSFWASAEDVGSMITDVRVGPYTRVIPEAVVRIVRSDGADVAKGETGELLVCSPTTSPGYWASSGEHVPMPDGTFRSGDLVREIAPGLLQCIGRKKDVIVRGGSNISPAEVEEVLRAHPDVLDAAVGGVPDDALGQRVGALLVLSGGESGGGSRVVSTEALLSWAGQRLAQYKLPERVGVVDAIPRNALTKIDRVAVRKALGNLGAG